MKGVSFFANRIDVRAQSAEQAARCAYLVAAVGCIALDSALSGLFYDDVASRRRSILNGVAYGDAGDGKVQNNIDMVLAVIRDRVDGGRVISARSEEHTTELQSLMRISYALFCVTKKRPDRSMPVRRFNVQTEVTPVWNRRSSNHMPSSEYRNTSPLNN